MICIKNQIETNYNIKINKIYVDGTKKYFFINDKKIYIKVIKNKDETNISELVKLTNELYVKNKHTQTFLMNDKGKYTIDYKNEKLALLMVNEAENIELNYNDILAGTINVTNELLKVYNIYEEWTKKVDSFERMIMEYNKEFPLIMKYANYYIGLAENAIQLLANTNYSNEDMNYLGHIIEENNYSYINYSNPFNYIKTSKLYDQANYFKYKIYDNKIDYEELEQIKNNLKLEKDKKIFLSLIIFPSEIIEKMISILLNEEKENDLEKYIKKIKDIEKIIKYIQENIINLECLKWL